MAHDWRTLDTMSEAIAQSSPSGHMSKRARKAASERFHKMLWGPTGHMPEPQGPPPEPEAVCLRRQAAELRRLAEGGMSPRKYRREAERLEARAAELDAVTA